MSIYCLSLRNDFHDEKDGIHEGPVILLIKHTMNENYTSENLKNDEKPFFSIFPQLFFCLYTGNDIEMHSNFFGSYLI